jgi:TPR repeat protein
MPPEGEDTAPPDAALEKPASTGERLDWVWLRPNRANPPVEPLDTDDCLSLASARRRAADEQFICDPVDAACLAVARSMCENGKGRRAEACLLIGVESLAGTIIMRNLSRAASAFHESCAMQKAFACSLLADMSARGMGVPKSAERAAFLYQVGCGGGDGYGCFRLALAFEHGQGVRRDDVAAAGMFSHSCDLGETFGCHALATRAEASGNGADADVLDEKACRHRLGLACRALGERALRAGRKDEATVRYLKGCSLQDVPSCTLLGAPCAGTSQPDGELCRQFLRKSCEGLDEAFCKKLIQESAR